MQFTMTKREAVEIYRTQLALSKALGLTHQAISHWEWDEPIPAGHALRIRYELKPELFESDAA